MHDNVGARRVQFVDDRTPDPFCCPGDQHCFSNHALPLADDAQAPILTNFALVRDGAPCTSNYSNHATLAAYYERWNAHGYGCPA